MDTEFTYKTILVVGLARSGLAAAEVLTQLGASVRLYDGKTADQLPEAVALSERLGLPLITGNAPVNYSELAYVVTSPGVPKHAPVLQNAVAAGVPVLGEIEAAYRIARAPILAITGTNGKTTTTVLLGEMLKAAGYETYLAGNIAAGEIAMPLIRAAYLAPPEAAIVAEISSFQLEWVERFRPRVAALLNITPDHGDRQSWDEYVAAKWRIFAAQLDGQEAVIHWSLYGQPEYGAYFNEMAARMWGFGADPPEQFTDEWDDCKAWSDTIALHVKGKKEFAHWLDQSPEICQISDVKLPGQHNRDNILAAAAMATAFGVGIEPIRQVATTFTGVVHRLEYTDTLNGVKYINNSMCTNLDAFEKSLEALPEPKVVIAGGVFKSGDLAPFADSVVSNNVKALVLIGQSKNAIKAAVRAAGYETVYLSPTIQEAVTQAAELAGPGDTVLLAPACASFDQFRDFEDRGDQFKAAVKGLREKP